MKQYVTVISDHTVSMRSIKENAMKDFNENAKALKDAAIKNDVDTIFHHVKCGYGYISKPKIETSYSSVLALKPMTVYEADAPSTPLWDSILQGIDLMEIAPDGNDPQTSFLMFITTDGGDNSSKVNSRMELAAKIKKLMATDRWTFVFRVPVGHKYSIIQSLGVSEDNVMEWEQTARGVETATIASVHGTESYFTAKASGVNSTQRFFTNLSGVKTKDVKANMNDVSSTCMFFPVTPADDGKEIRPFVESRLNGRSMLKGSAFYQLSKPERNVQDYKLIYIRDKKTQAVYGGPAARSMLGVPDSGDIKLSPGSHSHYDVFIQSTSVNRHLVAGTQVLYVESIGEPFGPIRIRNRSKK